MEREVRNREEGRRRKEHITKVRKMKNFSHLSLIGERA